VFKDGHSARRDAGSQLRARVCGLLVAVAALFAALAPPASAQVSSEFYGVNAGDLFKLPQAQWDPQLAAMSADGIRVLRLGAWWSDLEPGQPRNGVHYYAWGDTDQWVAALARHGIRWEPLLSFSATWDSAVPGDYTAYPANAADFAAFAAALASRYGPGGTFWSAHPELQPLPVQAYEIWNEPNAALFWHPQDSAPERYADLYAATRAAVHQGQPGATVVVGGLAAPGSGVIPAGEFVQRMLAHRPDLRGNIDAVAYHPYSPTTGGVYAQLAGFRAALNAAAGGGIPIEITEIGWSSVDMPVATIGAGLANLAATLPRADCGVDRLMPYDWVGPELDPTDREQWFGIQNRDGTAKASGAAYAGAVQQMESPSAPASGVTICGGAPDPSVAAPPAPRSAPRAHLRGPKLELRIRRDRRRPGRLRATARCPAGCRLSFQVLRLHRSAMKAGGSELLAQHTLRFSSRRRHVWLRIPARRAGRRVRVRVVATGRQGRHTVRNRTIRVR
jgi:polysaccharide biosynthesis protein PslG